MQSTEPVQASIKSWKFIDQIQPHGKMADELEIQIRAIPHNAIGGEMLGKLLNLLHDQPLDQPLEHGEGVRELERIAESQGLKFPKGKFLFLGLGHGKLFSHSNLNLDLEQISDLQKWAIGMKNQEGVAYIIDSDLLELKFQAKDSGFVSSHSAEGTSSALNRKTITANEHANNDVDDVTNQWYQMEQELQSKTQEILKLRETLVQKTTEKERIQKLLNLKTQTENSNELGSSQQTQSGGTGVVSESLENEPPGYNRDFDEVNYIKSEKNCSSKVDRPATFPTPMAVRSLETCQLPKQKPDVDRISRETQCEKEFRSEDDEMVCQSVSCHHTGFDGFFPVTLKNFGLNVFDEDSEDLLTHIEEVNRCAEEAGEMGATESQKIRLLMMSLPKEMKYVESFVPKAKKTEYKDFCGEVVKILGDKIRIAMNKFITTQRGPDESILKYFNRIALLYKNGNALVGTDWERDSGHVTAVYTKIYQALSDDGKLQLNRRLEDKLEQRILNIFELRRVLVEISKIRKEKTIEIRSFKLDTKSHQLSILQNNQLNN